MKKGRPHSWHSTLQRGFNRARSRSAGRGEREHRKEEKEQQANSHNSKGKRKRCFHSKQKELEKMQSEFVYCVPISSHNKVKYLLTLLLCMSCYNVESWNKT